MAWVCGGKRGKEGGRSVCLRCAFLWVRCWGCEKGGGKSGQKWAKVGKSGQKRAKRNVPPVFASPLPRPRSLLCALHTSTRVHSTLDAHAARMRARQRRAHALTQQHALAHAQKHSVVPRVTGHWLTVGRPAAEPSSAQLQRKCTRHLSLLTSHVHHPHAVHPTHHHCCHRTAET